MQLVGRIPNSEPDRDAIAMQVRTFKDKAKTVLEKLDQGTDKEEEATVDESSVAKLFEEVKVMFQDLPSRIEGRLDPIRHRKRRHFHPMMVEEILHAYKPDDPIGLLMVLGLLRDDMPWLYEIGVEVYRAIQRGNPSQIQKTAKSFQMALDLASHGPFAREFHDKETYFLLRESFGVVEHYMVRALERSKEKAKRIKSPTRS